MFHRLILKELEDWAKKANRKPLVLRGARQVGKTTVVNLFAKQFDQYINLNLELEEDRQLFIKNKNFNDLVEAIFFLKKKKRLITKTLLFIDEIQMVPEAVAQLRYFYEKAGDIYVIAAGSLLETLINRKINFPVGRVEFKILHPLSFEEYLIANSENESLKILKKIPLPDYAYDSLYRLFNRYAIIGGMPEVIKNYLTGKDLHQLDSIYESLIISYLDDVEKYASNQTSAKIIRHVINNAFFEAGNRITFQGFGRSNYRSREMSEAFQLLEKSMYLRLVYPTTQTQVPVLPDRKKSPKLQLVDTGLINYYADIQKDLFQSDDISHVFEGRIAEHLVGQELIAKKSSSLHGINFWIREKKQSSAEVDFVYVYGSKVIPIEVKLGTAGRLRSLHQFIDQAPHNIAVRFYSGKIQIDNTKTINGTPFYLLNLPYFMVCKLDNYLDWFIRRITNDH